MNVYVMYGIPGSGKSTWIKNNLGEDIPVVSRDIIRAKIGMCGSADEKMVGTREQEKEVTDRENELIKFYCKSDEDFVIDDTNTSKFRSGLISKLKEYGAKIILVKMNTPLDVCIKRRNGQIPSEIMQGIHDRVVGLNDDEYDEIIDVPYEEVED